MKIQEFSKGFWTSVKISSMLTEGSKVILLLGREQIGKTTLLRYLQGEALKFDQNQQFVIPSAEEGFKVEESENRVTDIPQIVEFPQKIFMIDSYYFGNDFEWNFHNLELLNLLQTLKAQVHLVFVFSADVIYSPETFANQLKQICGHFNIHKEQTPIKWSVLLSQSENQDESEQFEQLFSDICAEVQEFVYLSKATYNTHIFLKQEAQEGTGKDLLNNIIEKTTYFPISELSLSSITPYLIDQQSKTFQQKLDQYQKKIIQSQYWARNYCIYVIKAILEFYVTESQKTWEQKCAPIQDDLIKTKKGTQKQLNQQKPYLLKVDQKDFISRVHQITSNQKNQILQFMCSLKNIQIFQNTENSYYTRILNTLTESWKIILQYILPEETKSEFIRQLTKLLHKDLKEELNGLFEQAQQKGLLVATKKPMKVKQEKELKMVKKRIKQIDPDLYSYRTKGIRLKSDVKIKDTYKVKQFGEIYDNQYKGFKPHQIESRDTFVKMAEICRHYQFYEQAISLLMCSHTTLYIEQYLKEASQRKKISIEFLKQHLIPFSIIGDLKIFRKCINIIRNTAVHDQHQLLNLEESLIKGTKEIRKNIDSAKSTSNKLNLSYLHNIDFEMLMKSMYQIQAEKQEFLKKFQSD